MVYGYHRTSTKEQHLDRGIAEIKKYCAEHNMKLEKVYTDQQTGKNFNRARYIVLTKECEHMLSVITLIYERISNTIQSIKILSENA